ncbi:uncharacterized protein A1O5_04976 [Cladophialophora psammophila CBS 110553]|uniref:Fun14 family protein n=1 Tax=Cladophialophora psammophila CBS 110553 TaxID=1182543 RepID=W9WW98_9EURO|nr:uncharacterized protein A1O5_04976 [Cladophialophora psammophila CBS 110553]EXJ72472.1 hypothetical protein A1O5_04976 [Cladophialophora psammophila CBS 110553]
MLLRTVIRPSLSFPSAFRSISAPLPRAAFKRPVLIAFGLTASLPFIQPSSIIRLDSSPYSPPPAGAAEFSSTPSSQSRDPKVPLTKDGKTINPAAVKQISLGSILGLAAGLVVSAFSTSLTFLIGLGIVIWQLAARKGYNIIPVDRLQRYFKNIDLRSAINDNLAFKISFGLMFALSAFGEF